MMEKLSDRRIVADAAIAGVNIVPVIDLCLVLLVILLIISPLLEKPPVEVNLPKANTLEEKENNIAVTFAPDGSLALNTEKVSRDELPRLLSLLLKEQGPETLVIIRSDEKVKYGQLTDLMKTLKTAGAQNIALGTEQTKKDGVQQP